MIITLKFFLNSPFSTNEKLMCRAKLSPDQSHVQFSRLMRTYSESIHIYIYIYLWVEQARASGREYILIYLWSLSNI